MALASVADLLPPRTIRQTDDLMTTLCASVVIAQNKRTTAVKYFVVCPCLEPTGHQVASLDDAMRVLAEHLYTHDDQLQPTKVPPAQASEPAGLKTPWRPVDEERRPGRHG